MTKKSYNMYEYYIKLKEINKKRLDLQDKFIMDDDISADDFISHFEEYEKLENEQEELEREYENYCERILNESY